MTALHHGVGSDLPKQGIHAAGVKRQYGGEPGKRANCQAGVCGGDVSSTGSTVLDRRLSVPVEWVTDDAYAERRRQGGLPPEGTCTTKPALAQEMRATVVQTHGLRCRWVVADEACGCDTGFLDGVVGLGLWYVAALAHTTRVWHERPGPPTSRRGVGAPDDQGRQPGAHGGGVCRQAGARRAGHLARS